MIEIKKDSKSPTYIVTRTDNEDFHHQLQLTEKELMDLAEYAIRVLNKEITKE